MIIKWHHRHCGSTKVAQRIQLHNYLGNRLTGATPGGIERWWRYMPPCLPIITFTLSSYFESIKVTRTLHLLDDFPGERSAESATRIFRYARDSLDITRVLTRNCRLAGTRRGVLHKTEEENDRATSSFLAGSGRARRSAPSRTRRDPAASSSNCVNVTCTHSRKELEKLKRMMLFDNVLLHLLITRSARGDNRTSQLALAHFFGIAVHVNYISLHAHAHAVRILHESWWNSIIRPRRGLIAGIANLQSFSRLSHARAAASAARPRRAR